MDYVYVLNTEGKPLMPTSRLGKVRRLLNNKQAKVIRRKPFTIQLLYSTTNYSQNITLGIDSGQQHIGISAVTETKEVFSSEVELLKGMKERNKERKSYRRTRRGRLRYRKPRFDNRKKKEGWLAPSIQHKLDSHIRFIESVKSILPITKTIVEVAAFDTQKILNPDIEGKEYQEGVQKDFWNLREYILHRDNHKCKNPNCKNKSTSPILVLHHITFRSNGGSDSPNNLITLCNQCHTPKAHQTWLKDWKPKVLSLKGATFMSTVRWKLVNTLDCEHTYGYQTKSKRIELGIEKSHINDAFVIAGGTTQKRTTSYEVEQTRRNNRSIETLYDAQYLDSRDGKKKSGKELFNGRTTRNKNLNMENLRVYRQVKIKKGDRRIREQRSQFQPKDLVYFEGKKYLVIGSMNKGKSLKLKNSKRYPNTQKVEMIKRGKGFCFV